MSRIIDWREMAQPLFALANNASCGRKRHSPVIMLKLVFLQFLYDRSDREMEDMATYDIRVKQFLGLAIDDKAPDYSCLSRFRDEIMIQYGETILKEWFDDILTQAQAHGIRVGTIWAMDATHVESSINGKKDSHEVKKYVAKSKDPDAAWGCKGQETKITPKGKKVQVGKHFFGYKAHVTNETTHNLVTAVSVTSGNVTDIDAGDELLNRKITKQQRAHIDAITADAGYGCPVFINFLEKHQNILTAFALPKTMTDKNRSTNPGKWQQYKDDPGRRAIYKERTSVERIFGEIKQHHGLRRARYKGLDKLHLQTIFSMMAHNIKILTKAITGARFKPI